MTTVEYEKAITANIGQYNSLRLSVSKAPSFEECDRLIIKELTRLDIPINDRIKTVLQWPKE